MCECEYNNLRRLGERDVHGSLAWEHAPSQETREGVFCERLFTTHSPLPFPKGPRRICAWFSLPATALTRASHALPFATFSDLPVKILTELVPSSQGKGCPLIFSIALSLTPCRHSSLLQASSLKAGIVARHRERRWYEVQCRIPARASFSRSVGVPR